MLYLYSFYENFNNEKDYEKAMENVKGLKPLGFSFYSISKSDSVIMNGKKVKAVSKLCDLIEDGTFGGGECGDYMEIRTILADKIQLEKTHAIEMLADDLRLSSDGCNEYEDRIWNAENPGEEIERILSELMLVVIDMLIKEIEMAYTDIKNNGFEWK